MTDHPPLKPCPFCGSDNIVQETCDLRGIVLYGYLCRACPGMQMTDELAIAEWNRRAPVEITEEMVERAVRAWWRSAHPNTAAENFVDPCEIIWMRAALAAALGQA